MRVGAIRAERGEQRAAGGAAAGERQLEIVPDGVALEDGRLLELAADAELGDRRLVDARQVDGAVEIDVAGVGARLAGDDVHHGRLAGAVGADDGAHLALLDDQRQFVQRLEAVEGDGDAVEVEERVQRLLGHRLTPPPSDRSRARAVRPRACRRSDELGAGASAASGLARRSRPSEAAQACRQCPSAETA